jgi:hypothetical protein
MFLASIQTETRTRAMLLPGMIVLSPFCFKDGVAYINRAATDCELRFESKKQF